jgi:hypothetical protein
MIFVPLRGWNLKGRVNDKLLDSMTTFILTGLGLDKN